MKKEIISNLLFVLGVCFLNVLFWKEQMGLNVLLFSIFSILGLFACFPESRTSKNVYITVGGTLLSALMVVLNNSILSKCIYTLSFFTMVGFVHQRSLRFVWYAFLLGIGEIFKVKQKFFQKIDDLRVFNLPVKKALRYSYLSVVPIFIVSIFFTLYSLSNEQFAMRLNLWNHIVGFFTVDISLERVAFITVSIFVSGGIFWNSEYNVFKNLDANKTEKLVRIRRLIDRNASSNMLALKNEFRMGMILLVLLNILILFMNITDLQFILFDYGSISYVELRQFVHEGTYILIASILMAMGVLLYLFRRNLNFFSNNGFLKILAYAWIVQNGILAFSVGMRNYKYIEYYGLAYKRIGVVIFLLLVFIGLITMFWKIKYVKTLYYLCHRNAWAVYLTLLIATCVNWDIFITNYNLQANTKDPLDAAFLIQKTSEKNLYILKENIDLIKEKTSTSDHLVDKWMANKEARFKAKKSYGSIFSWNLPDARNEKKIR